MRWECSVDPSQFGCANECAMMVVILMIGVMQKPPKGFPSKDE